jgi:hypothetical protein
MRLRARATQGAFRASDSLRVAPVVGPLAGLVRASSSEKLYHITRRGAAPRFTLPRPTSGDWDDHDPEGVFFPRNGFLYPGWATSLKCPVPSRSVVRPLTHLPTDRMNAVQSGTTGTRLAPVPLILRIPAGQRATPFGGADHPRGPARYRAGCSQRTGRDGTTFGLITRVARPSPRQTRTADTGVCPDPASGPGTPRLTGLSSSLTVARRFLT